jgi:hypothetical protein
MLGGLRKVCSVLIGVSKYRKLTTPRFFHQDGNYARCPGGKDGHYDMSLWLTDGFKGGAGGDWGQRLATEQFLSDVRSGKDSVHIFLHEMVSHMLHDKVYC